MGITVIRKADWTAAWDSAAGQHCYLRNADVDFLTIGQYLQPTLKHIPVDRFVTPDEFDDYRLSALAKGFLLVSATPLTRSSYHAGDDFAQLRAARQKKLGLG